MATCLRFGAQNRVEIDAPAGAIVVDCPAPRGEPAEDIALAVCQALAEPLEFPPLAEAVVPGDHIVIVVEHGVPRANEVVAAVVEWFSDAGVEPADICVLLAPEDGALEAATLARLGGLQESARAGQPRLDERRHDPTDRGSLAYLANIGEGKPVYLNRLICEADFLVPIGCARLETPGGLQSPSEGMYPAFADPAARARYRSPKTAASPVQRNRLRQQAREVEWLLGAMFSIRVVPGPGDSVLAVAAGESRAVEQWTQSRCDEAWRFSVPEPADLVVAAIEGGPAQQTWDHVARALAAAKRAAREGGAIAILSELDTPPGPAMQFLSSAESPQDALHAITHERPDDALAAAQLIHSLEGHRVYLLSRLEAEVVESLGMAPMADAGEVRRLVARHDSCVFLANAQHAARGTGRNGRAGRKLILCWVDIFFGPRPLHGRNRHDQHALGGSLAVRWRRAFGARRSHAT